ncbi:MAG: winged helix-turn-helix transcriptional regulator [Candidatus Helarchaeota archaeon]
MTELDKEILKILRENSRIQYKRLAEHVNKRDTTIHYRIKKMLKEGTIKKFTIIMGDKERKIFVLFKIKVGGHIILDASIKKARLLGEKLGEIFNFVALLEDKVTICGIINVKDVNELNDIIKTLKKDPDILNFEYNVLDILKGEDFLGVEISLL